MKRKYTLSYLPLFETDLNAAWRYVARKLRNPEAADKLVSDTEAAILKRLAAPEAFEARHIGRKRERPYYRLHGGFDAGWRLDPNLSRTLSADRGFGTALS